MFEQIFAGIGEFFSDLVAGEYCVGCFLKGVAVGFGIGIGIGIGVLAAIAGAPAWLAVAITVGVVGLGIYGAVQLVNNWDGMSRAQKSEAVGGIVGGLIAGRFGPPLPPRPLPIRIPSVQWLATPEGVLMPVLVATETTVSATAGSSAAAAAGGVAMMASGGPSPPPGRHDQNDVSERIRELSKQGHGPQRHEGKVTEEQLRARAVEGKDPVNGKTEDAYLKKPDGTRETHKYGSHATKVNYEEAYVSAEESLQSSNDFKVQAASKQVADRIAVEKNLDEIYGPNYKDKVSGVTREGTKKNPTGSHPTDFTDGTMKAVYELDANGNWNLVTMYPEPK